MHELDILPGVSRTNVSRDNYSTGQAERVRSISAESVRCS